MKPALFESSLHVGFVLIDSNNDSILVIASNKHSMFLDDFRYITLLIIMYICFNYYNNNGNDFKFVLRSYVNCYLSLDKSWTN